jgi:hypothetical protein
MPKKLKKPIKRKKTEDAMTILVDFVILEMIRFLDKFIRTQLLT